MNRVQYRLVALSVTPCWVVHDFFAPNFQGCTTTASESAYSERMRPPHREYHGDPKLRLLPLPPQSVDIQLSRSFMQCPFDPLHYEHCCPF